MRTLDFWSLLVIQWIKNTIATEPNDIGRPIRACITTQIVKRKLDKVPNYHEKYLTSEKVKTSKQKYQKQRCNNHS